MASSQKRVRQSSRAKISRMVADGTRNYPSYLKLIYTGDSEFSSEDESVMSPNHPPSLSLNPQPPIMASVDSPLDYKPRVSDYKPRVSDYKPHVSDYKPRDNDSKPKACTKAPPNLPITTPKEAHPLAIADALTSPESFKLKDDAKEKTKTPVSHSSTPTSKHFDLFDNQAFPMTGSWHAFNNDKIVLNQDNHVERLQLERELLLIQDEIGSLRSVLETKVALATELKKRLGVTTMTELKQGLANIKQSGTFQRTNAALKSLGGLASRTISSIKSSRSFFKTPQLEGIHNIKQSMSMADMCVTQSNLKFSRSATNVCIPETSQW